MGLAGQLVPGTWVLPAKLTLGNNSAAELWTFRFWIQLRLPFWQISLMSALFKSRFRFTFLEFLEFLEFLIKSLMFKIMAMADIIDDNEESENVKERQNLIFQVDWLICQPWILWWMWKKKLRWGYLIWRLQVWSFFKEKILKCILLRLKLIGTRKLSTISNLNDKVTAWNFLNRW